MGHRLRLACGLLTPSLRQIPISQNTDFNYREESGINSGLLSSVLLIYNGIIFNMYNMHQMSHTSLFEPRPALMPRHGLPNGLGVLRAICF